MFRQIQFNPSLSDLFYCLKPLGFWDFFREQLKTAYFNHLKTTPACLKSTQIYTFCIYIQEILIISRKILENPGKNLDNFPGKNLLKVNNLHICWYSTL